MNVDVKFKFTLDLIMSLVEYFALNLLVPYLIRHWHDKHEPNDNYYRLAFVVYGFKSFCQQDVQGNPKVGKQT